MLHSMHSYTKHSWRLAATLTPRIRRMPYLPPLLADPSERKPLLRSGKMVHKISRLTWVIMVGYSAAWVPIFTIYDESPWLFIAAFIGGVPLAIWMAVRDCR